ncbi:MAG: methyltransferase domain-containing protein [Cytophagaceae bacterium]|jgi:2-polyprenyl-3-methyl-5-hydroxy-6-metoxy-1,4-benzoquinol methylase|nr:methyltransferase domain-containing protein [Cytophagaceae bacterium]
MKLNHRSSQKELLDEPNIPTAALHQNLKELDTINALLGGDSINQKALLKFKLPTTSNITILDVGCGSGGSLVRMAEFARTKGFSFRLIGVDITTDCITYAQRRCVAYPEISFITCDYQNIAEYLQEPPDIIFSSLFTHHLSDVELVSFLQWMEKTARIGYFINDLHRHVVAYYSIRVLTKLFSSSYLVQNDAPISVSRGFRIADWKTYIQAAAIPAPTIKWQWAFRWLVFRKKI